MPSHPAVARLSQMWLIAQRVVLLAAGLFVWGMVWRSLAPESDWLSQIASRGLTISALLTVAGASIWIVYSLAFRPSCVPLLLFGGGLLLVWQLAHLAEFLAGPEQISPALRVLRTGAGWGGMALLLAAFYLALVEAAIARARLEYESAELRHEVEQRTLAEEALRLARDQLEERVRVRTSELRAANEQLQREVIQHARTADSLQRSEARFQYIAASTGEWIWEMDACGRFTYCSQALSDLLGYSPEEVIGVPCTRFLAPDEAAPLPDPQSSKRSTRIARWHLHRDGRPLLLQSAVATVCDAGGTVQGYHGATRDITLQYQLERQIEQTRNMEMVGQLASGVAHDFNNLVGVILGCCDSARQALDAGDPVQRMLGILKEAAQQATGLTQSLLLLGSHRPVEMQPIDLTAMLEQTRRLLQHLLPREMGLEIAIPPGPVWVLADWTQLQQALLNLAVNARDAMPGGGRLTIQLTHLGRDQLREPPPVPSPGGTYARLEVADTGGGIPLEAQARIFDPFYTTKARGQGAGLGLAIVDSIIKNHKGWVRVRSEPGQGATFSLFLPGAQAPVGEQSLPAPHPAENAGVAVLMAAGQRLMRGMVASELSDQGRRVMLFSGVEELLRTLRQDSTTIGLLVVDSSQAEELWAVWPAVRACQADLLLLLLSDGEEPSPPEDARMRMLSLPFDAARFTQCVDEILRGRHRDDENYRDPGGRSCPVAADAGLSSEPGA